jgi:hypothetical protein
MKRLLRAAGTAAVALLSTSLAAAPRTARQAPSAGREIPSAYGRLAPARGFEDRYGGSWWQRRGGPTGDFVRVFGEGVPLDPASVADDLVAVAEVERFFRDNAQLLPPGVSPADLELRSTIAWRDRRIVSFEQRLDGVPVEGSSIYAVVVRGRLVLLGVRAFPAAPVETRAVLDTASAERIARGALRDLRGKPESGSARHVVLPMAEEDALELRSAFAVPLRLDGRGKWTAYIGADDGALLALEDERRTMTGSIAIEHHDRNPGGDLIADPAAFLDFTANGAAVTTDSDGAFEADGGTADVTGGLAGPFVEVQTMTGDDLALAASDIADGATYQWASDGSEIPLSQLDAYVFAQAVSDRARSLQDDVPWLDQPLTVRPNQPNFEGESGTGYCNAWSDGETVNFLMAGASGSSECNNTAMVADVVYHEYGHCLHIQNSALGVNVFDGSASEAFGDTMSVSMTHDNVIGPYFFTDGSGIRDVAPDMVWPDDYTDDENYVHYNGLILGGALWDLRQALVAELGEDEGHRTTDEIFVAMLRLTEDIPSSFEAALAADDDDGDLANGTPNACALYAAFEPHGLVSSGLGRVVIDHAPVAFAPEPGAPIEIAAGVSVSQEECATLGAVRVVYSSDAGATWTDIDMAEVEEGSFAASIPGFPAGTELRYRLEVEELDSGTTIVRPTNAAEPYYTIYVGPLTEILCDDFEGADDGGWTHELLAGDAAEGADDWQRDTPTGAGGDPEGAYSGENGWGNDLALEDTWNGQYQADKTNTLRSPTYDLSAYHTVRLAFRRWLGVEDGYYDKARVYVNEQEVWSNAASAGDDTADHTMHHQDAEWILADLDVSAIAGGAAAVQVRFEIQSDSGLQLGGWNIDDFCLYTVGVSDPDGGVDAGAQDAGGQEPDASAGADSGADASPVDIRASASGCGCDAVSAPGAGSLLGALL